ncbi:EF-P 5-aminopentanol modification-associated protein YfmF [Lysinibacillus sp. BW-2-10]|uniref:EF-P 5-aminopentanol modification-associated protein YfmF n=1 Tax=Lysinibacillus sp. BW-2-10 TaxID=2590030 RepID=UPI001180BA98|nr:pitrilysin family protein [Lysinibacillus sp. BW-2-10]TSI11347.1 insulinase family protein [Lysinibacillus sp. BW-2-10]
MFLTTKLAEGVNLHMRQTTQFKTVNFSIKWRSPLTTETAAERAVLSNVLQHSNGKYKKSAQFRSYLDDLFGTVLYFDASKRGNEHTVLLNVETVNDQYLAQNKVSSEVLELLNTVIFEPNFENGQFVPSIVEREKEMVIQRIQSIFDDKTRYAQTRLTQIIRPNHPASISANGTIDTVKQITPESLTKTYHSMINEDKIDIYVVGDIDVEAVQKKLIEYLPFTDRTPKPLEVNNADVKPEKEYTKEQQDMKQGKLHIGLSTPVMFGDEDFPKMQIFNGIFGGYAHSKLFMNVREKESLAYYASSSYSSHYGLVYVVSGIEPAKEKKATDVIFEQLEAMKKGEITDLELSQTKAMLINQLKEALDLARGQIDIYDQYKDLEEQFSIDLWKERWENVTKEDVQKMASQVELEAIYFLCGKEA